MVYHLNSHLRKFKVLTTWVETGRVENLLEGTLYLKEAFKFIDLLLLFDSKKLGYELVSGFKGFTNFKDKQNKFKEIEVSSDEIGKIKSVISSNFTVNELDGNKVSIRIKE